MNMLRNVRRTGLTAGVLLAAMTASLATIQVELNGQRLSFPVPPTQVNGRTLVPLRGIFEALGAEVRWDGPTQTITANKGATNVQLGIGNPNATVNTRTVVLDTPAMIRDGATLVPLRFVSEALGANVTWNSAAQLVAITTEQQQLTASISLPSSTVIPVTLDKAVSSATNVKGDAVTATVRSTKNGDAEFPLGTKLNGVVSDVTKKTTTAPGVLAMTFQEAVLPDGQKVPLTGSVSALDEKSVTQSADGHLIANDKTSNDTLKFVAIGTGAGLILGKLTENNALTTSLIGAAAGYLYSTTTKDATKTADVTVSEGTTFGVRFDQAMAFTTGADFVTARAAYLQAHPTASTTTLPQLPVLTNATVSLPANTVIPATLDKAVTSATNVKGDAVTATVRSTQNGDAEFPLGTKLNGVVSEVTKKTATTPGMLALTFQEAVLPDGRKLPISGTLMSLDEKSVTQSADGHLIANGTTTNDTLKFIAIGTGAGLILGKLTDANTLTSSLLGAAAGYIYSTTTKEGTKPADVTVSEGTAFGVRLTQPLTFDTSSTFVAARTAYLQAHPATK